MLIKRYLLSLLLLVPLLALAQEPKYPIEILPGQSKTFSPSSDTLWVLKHSQMQKALMFGKENKLLQEEVQLLRQQVQTHGQLNNATDTLAQYYAKDAAHYKGYWQECDKDLQIVARKYKRQKLYNKFFLGGIVASFALGLLLFR